MKRILSFLLAVTMLFTMLPAAVLAGGVDVGTEVVTEQIVTGTISFPEDAYLDGGSLIVDVWVNGQITGEYKKVEFEIDSLEDADFEFLFPANETAVSTRVMLSNLSGAKTNLYTETPSNFGFTLTENGMVNTYEDHYFDIAELATKEILMPCGKTISGIISGDNLQFIDNACMKLIFGNYWTRAYIDSETHEYTAVMPYGIVNGYYAPKLENGSENATSNALVGTYYYTESESVTINTAEDLTDLNFTVDTGYAVSGEVTIPENAVMDNYEITSWVEFNDSMYYITGLTTKPAIGENNRRVPFMFGVDKNTVEPVSTTFRLEAEGYMADDMLSSTSYSNVLVNTPYYYSEQGTTLDEAEATVVTIDSDIDGIVFDLQIGAVCNAEITVPESVSGQYIWYDLYAISLDGDIIAKTEERIIPGNAVNYAQLVIPATYDEIYMMYKIGYDTYGEYPDIYTGKAYINADGSITGFRSDADSHSTYGDVTVQFELAEFDDVEIPETFECEGNALESSHPFLSSYTESIYYAYDGNEDASNLKVTFSPLSWINEKATITICDAESNSTTYTSEEFNECISGETIDITGLKFTVDITSVYTSQYMYDYGFAITDVTPGEPEVDEDETALFNFKVYDNSVTTANLLPIEGATVTITDAESFSYMGTSDENGGVMAELVIGNTYEIEVSKDGYVTYTEDFEATLESAEEMNYLPLTKAKTEAFFVVLDEDTGKVVPNASISVVNAEDTTASEGISLSTGANGNTPSAMLESGTYTVVTSADGYVRDTQNVEISGKAKEVVIWLQKMEVVIADNTTFTVMDGETEGTPVISGASLTITDEEGNVISAKTTDSAGKATANLEDGVYHITAIADGFEAESYTVERTDSNNEFPIYLYRDGVVTVKTSVKEMTLDEMEDAGIDTEALGNKQVYNCTAVLSFMPDVTINYIYSDDGAVLKGGTFTEGGKSITPVAKDIYLLVKSQTSWLKETFEVQIICDNNSAIETIENLTADLTLPEGLSLAIMAEGEQTTEAVLGTVAPKGNASHKWYICGDAKGEYLLEGRLTGKRTGGITTDMELNFGTSEPIIVLAGDAMTLTIDAETSATVGEPYIMRYTLENVSEKTIYNLSYSVLGGKFFDDYTVTAAEYAKEYGPDGVKDVKGEGFLFETKEFKPGEKISGVFEITFGEELLLGEGQEWKLTDAFVVTGLGSTTVIPTNVNWLPVVPKHNWDEGEITKAATCTEDGVRTYRCMDANCEEFYTDVIKATGHLMGDYVRVEPTCTEEGSETSSCQNDGCDHTVVLPLAALGHNWDDEYTVDTQPECTTDGSKSKHCSECDEKSDVQSIAATGHSMGDWTEAAAPTCTTEGTKRRGCGNCDYYETDTIPSKGHNWDKGVVTTPATEEKEGVKTFTCGTCKETKTEPVPVLVKQQLEFARIGDITEKYGQFKYVDNMAYNDSENGSELVYSSSNTDVATVDENGRATILNAGETIITATAAATDIYAETEVSYKLTVNKAELTITPVNVEIFYGEAPELKEYSATGFVLDEDKTVLSGDAVYLADYEQYGKVGTYKISVSGLSAKNYDINFADGTLTVKKAENYVIGIENLTQRKGSTEAVKTTISPKDASAVIKVEYKIAEDTWAEEVPTEIGEYDVRASLVSAENIAPKAEYYSEAVLTVKAGAMIDIDGDSDVSIDTKIDGDKIEFNITDENVEAIINSIPSNGEVVIDAYDGSDGVKELTLPSNIINALDESGAAKSLTVITHDAEITMDTKVLETVANKVSETDKVSIHIDAVEKEELNEKQQEALDTLGGDNAVILQLNLVVTSYEDGEPVNEQVHQLNGNVDVRAAYTLPDDMIGKRVLVCYVADDGSVSYVRAKYENGFVSFTTNHFSHYAVVTMPCPHDWDNGTVITEATTTSTGVMRYTCLLCDETKDETIPVETVSYNRGSSSVSIYTVTYQTNGGSQIKKTSVNKDAVLAEPDAPTKEGFKFDGWYTDKELTTAYNFAAKVTKSFTLYAKWTEIENEQEATEADTTISFKDVKTDDWFYEDVQYAVENKLMNGVAEDSFAPDATLTRAMLVTVLYRNAGEPAVNKSIPFSDIDMGAYYANAVVWAKQNGIINGVTENEFVPNADITREQIATIMFRYAIYKGMDAVTMEENLHYDDADKISEYAVSAMNWAIGSGLMKGKTTSILGPVDNATRAEFAAILHRFIETDK